MRTILAIATHVALGVLLFGLLVGPFALALHLVDRGWSYGWPMTLAMVPLAAVLVLLAILGRDRSGTGL